MGSKKSNIIWFGVSTLILGGLIYFADPRRFIDAVVSAKILYLIPAFIAGFSSFFVLGYTWHRFLGKAGLEISYLKSYRLFMSGQFMNSITPIGQFGGEPFMAYIIKENTDLSYEKSFSSVFSADLVNAIPVFTFIFGGSLFLVLFGSLNSLIIQALYSGVILTILGGLFVYTLWFKAGVIESFIMRFLRKLSELIGRGETILDKLEKRLEEVQEVFESIGEDKRHLVKTIAISHIFFLLQVVALFLILVSLNVDADFTPLYFILAISGLANFAPTPGGSGAYEATMSGLLKFFLGINIELAVAAAIITRLTNYWPGILVGYISMITLEGKK